MLESGTGLRQGSIPAGFGATALWVLSSVLVSYGQGQNLILQIPPVRTSVKLENQPVAITASGTLNVSARQEGQIAFQLELVADLSDLQQNLTPILSAGLDKSDRCSDRIDIQHATLVPADPSGIVTVQFHYERWACTKVFGKESAHRLVGGNALAQLKVTPQVDKSRMVRLQPELGTIQADGSLGEILRNGQVEQMLREKISHVLASAADKGTDFSVTLPPAAQGFATVQGARFKDAGDGRLALVLNGEIHVTSQQAEILKSQLRERAQRALRNDK